MKNNERLLDEQRIYFSSEPKPLKDAFELLCAEYGRTLQLFSNPKYTLEGSKLLARQVIYILLLKQYELVKSSFNSFITFNYASTAILARSIVETSAFCYYLSKHPQEAEDFVLFSDVIGHPEVDWKRLKICNRRNKLSSSNFPLGNYARSLQRHRSA